MSKPYIIGVSGGSGSGKTHFIDLLSTHFKPGEVCAILMDHYYKPIAQQPVDENGIVNFDLPESIDRKAFEEDVVKLIEGKMVKKQEYTFNNPAANPVMLTFHPAPILVIEGLFVHYFEEIADRLDLKIFIDAEDQLKLSRRILRDREERGYEESDVQYRYRHHASPVFYQLIEPLKSKSDMIIPNNRNFDVAVGVLVAFLRQKLSGIAN